MGVGSRAWVRALGIGASLALSAPTAFAQAADQWREPPADPVPEPAQPDPAREVRGGELSQVMPDLDLRLRPPPFTIIPGLTAFIPFQGAGLGIRLEAFPIEWLRLEAVYSGGFGLGREEPFFTNYAEALLGVRAFGAGSERAVEIEREPQAKSVGRPWGRPAPSTDVELRVWLPSYHALFVEGGMLTGFVALDRCAFNCDNGVEEDDIVENADRQLFVPFAGLRYLYFIHARSKKKQELSRAKMSQVYVHLLFGTINEPAQGSLWAEDGRTATRAAVGARVGLEQPACANDCISAVVEGGYLPSPGSLLLSAGIRKRF
jgi:hypothetical protein